MKERERDKRTSQARVREKERQERARRTCRGLEGDEEGDVGEEFGGQLEQRRAIGAGDRRGLSRRREERNATH